jgi:hypothetical protein
MLSLGKKEGDCFEFMRSSIQSALAIAVKVQKTREFEYFKNALPPATILSWGKRGYEHDVGNIISVVSRQFTFRFPSGRISTVDEIVAA